MSSEIEICQIRGQVSQDSHCWTKLLQKEKCGPGRDWQKSKRYHVQITCGLTLRQELEKPLREEKNKNGQSRNWNSNTLENWGVYSIDPSDEENKDIVRNARRKLETSKAAVMPCKRAFLQACIRETVVSKTEKQGIWSKDQIQFYHRSPWIHKTKNGVGNEKDSWRTHRGKRAEFCIALLFN